MKKRAASKIISTVLLIMIGIVLAMIIWNFSKDIISNQTSQTEGSSYYYNARIISADFRDTGVATMSTLGKPQNINVQELELAIQRLDNKLNVTGVRFTFITLGGTSYSKNFYDNPPNDPKIRVYTIKNTDVAEGFTFNNVTSVKLRLIYGNSKATETLYESEIFQISST